jgi:hypothetical protein
MAGRTGALANRHRSAIRRVAVLIGLAGAAVAAGQLAWRPGSSDHRDRAARAASAPRGDLVARASTPGATSRSQPQPRLRANCFAAPGRCGYPDPQYGNVGARSACTSLTPSQSITASTRGQTIEALNVTGTITVTAPGVTIDNVCVTTNGGGQFGSAAVMLRSGAADTLIKDSTIRGANESTQSVQIAVDDLNRSPATARNVYVSNCGECFWGGPWTIADSYVISSGMQGTTDHMEDLYCSDATETLTHDTLLNPQDQTATVFCDTGFGQGGPCANHITITDSLLAGGASIVYPCGNASSAGSSTMNISRNRIARCTSPPLRYNGGTGGTTCRGSAGTSIGSGADLHGYWPGGGYFGVAAYIYCSRVASRTWADNVWDNNSAGVRCPAIDG